MTAGVGMSREGSLEEAGLHDRPLQVELDTGLQGGEQRKHIQPLKGLDSSLLSLALTERSFFLLSLVIHCLRTAHRFTSH